MKAILIAIALAFASISAASAFQTCTTNCTDNGNGQYCTTTCF